MDIATALAADLHEVAAGLQNDPHGTEATLSMLTHNLRLAVRSYRGLELSAYVSDLPITVSTFEPLVRRDDIVTSLRLPLATLVDSDPRSQLVIYAGRAGALVDLASDLAYALRVTHDLVALDDHREPTTLHSGLSGLDELTTVNRAIGVLLGAGQSASEARRTLRRRADDLGVDLATASAAVIEDAVPQGAGPVQDG